MGPFSEARWTRSQSAPPCPGAWSYRILGRFPLSAASVERQQQQEQQVAVPQAERLGPNGGTIQPHPPRCCVHPQYGYLNRPPEVPPVPVDIVHNSPVCPGHYIPANTNYAVQSSYYQPCASGYPPQYSIRDHAHVHPTPHGIHQQPPPLHPQAHSNCIYPLPAPPNQQSPVPQTNLIGVSQRLGVVHSHSSSVCQQSHPRNEGQYQIFYDPRPRPTQQHHHRHPWQGAPSAGLPQLPTWNAVNCERSGGGSRALSHGQSTIDVALEGQGTFERPFIIHTPAEGPTLSRTSTSGRTYPHSTIGSGAAGSLQKQQAVQSPILPSSSNLSLQLHPHAASQSNFNTRTNINAFSTIRNPSSAPIKRTRKSYTREYKLKALNLLNGERPDGKGGMVPASDTWVSRQVGVTRKVLRGWKAQEERLRASRKGSRRVRVGRNRERRPAGGAKERNDKGKGKEIETHGAPPRPATSIEGGISFDAAKSPQDIETSSEDEQLGTPIARPCERHSTEDADEGENDDPHQRRTTRTEGRMNITSKNSKPPGQQNKPATMQGPRGPRGMRRTRVICQWMLVS